MSADDWGGEDRREPVKERWHVRKEVNISHIILTISLFAGAVIAYDDLRDADRDAQTGINGNENARIAAMIHVREEMAHAKELQAQRDLSQDTEIIRIYNQIEDARQEFRDEHLLTRNDSRAENRETRKIVADLIKARL